MNNTRKITTALFALALLFGTQAVAKDKIDMAKHTQHLAPAEKIEKQSVKLKPKHLYVKSDEQIKREFLYKKQRGQKFSKMEKKREQHFKREKIRKEMKVQKGNKNAQN